MKLKQIVLLIVFLILSVLGYFIWTVQQRGKTAADPEVNLTSLKQPDSNDRLERIRFHDELQAYLAKEDFQALETIAAEITKQKSRFPGGDWKLKRFFESVASPPHGYNEEIVDWPKRIAMLLRWKEQLPDSIYAKIATARAFMANASDHAHDGQPVVRFFPDSDQAYEEAEALLRSVYDRRAECVDWFTTMQGVGYHKHWNLSQMRALFDEAVKIEPLYYDIYRIHADYLLPKKHGKPGDWEAFVEESAKSIGGIEGEILYSEVCFQISQSYNLNDYYKHSKVSYPRIRDGFIERFKKYGASYRYMNALCKMAGAAADQRTTRALMEKIGDNWEPDFWADKDKFDEYKKWAYM